MFPDYQNGRKGLQRSSVYDSLVIGGKVQRSLLNFTVSCGEMPRSLLQFSLGFFSNPWGKNRKSSTSGRVTKLVSMLFFGDMNWAKLLVLSK